MNPRMLNLRRAIRNTKVGESLMSFSLGLALGMVIGLLVFVLRYLV